MAKRNPPNEADKSQFIGAEELADLTGLTDRRHRQISAEGYFPKPNRGQYRRLETIQGLFRYYRERSEKDLLTKSRKELVDEKVVEQRIRNGELKGEYTSNKALAGRLRALGEEIKGTLNFHLSDRLPALNAGLDATKQRVNNRAVFEQIMRRWQEFAQSWTS